MVINDPRDCQESLRSLIIIYGLPIPQLLVCTALKSKTHLPKNLTAQTSLGVVKSRSII
jgi:hypothetical protein